MQREQLTFDVIIVGGGPAGLAAALTLSRNRQPPLSVCLLEKAAHMGGHSLSGALVPVEDLAALLPDPTRMGCAVSSDTLLFLSPEKARAIPQPSSPPRRLISLGQLCRVLANMAHAQGVTILTGFAATELLIENGQLVGVQVGDLGRHRHGGPKSTFQPGPQLRAPITILAEGSRGFLTQQAIATFGLAGNSCPQTYALGIKELWQLPHQRPGHVVHTFGWPLTGYGGGFLYLLDQERAAVGHIVGLDYQNPWLDPLAAFHQWKRHPAIAATLQGGHPIAFGARTLTVGGWQSLPQTTFPGGVLVGDGAGFLDPAQRLGVGPAIQSATLAAEAVWQAIVTKDFACPQLVNWREGYRQSKQGQRLWRGRNIRPGFRQGLWPGVINALWEKGVAGRSPWTLQWSLTDRQRTKQADSPPPPPTNMDHPALLALAGIRHQEDQPCHLHVGCQNLLEQEGWRRFRAPESRYCPGRVYTITPQGERMTLQIHPGNCLHCKCCDIKDPMDTVRWTPPEGGSGPHYGEM